MEGDRNMVVEENCSVPKGGPIYIPNLISPLTTVTEFQNLVIQQLQELEAELNSSELTDAEDVSVDDLKVLKDEELVEMALAEVLKDHEHAEDDAESLGNCSNSQKSGDKHARVASSSMVNASTSINSTDECPKSNGADLEKKNGAKKQKKSGPKSQKKRKARNCVAEEPYIEKVEQLVKIKKKQDEDKATARLHCLNAVCRTNDSATSSDKTERMKSLRSMNSSGKVKTLDVAEDIPVSYPEVVLCVEVYHQIRNGSKTQEFLVLGHQTLTELKDKIYCLTDQMMQKAGTYDPSGYFLIEDVFLNDLRDPSAIDYSEPIFHWLRNSKDDAVKKWESIITGELQQKKKAILGSVTPSRLPEFKAVDMHKTRFCDLRFQLGAGYLYCHQGDCKHTIVIRDMRLIHPEDIHNRAAYPVLIFQLKTRVQKCSVCAIYRATKITVDDKWAKDNPCYFCDQCFSLLHFHDGSPLYTQYTLYDYIHDYIHD